MSPAGGKKRKMLKKHKTTIAPCNFDDDTTLDKNKIKNINMLSLDCLANVFMRLPISDRLKVEKVCLYWKEASELSWHDIKKLDCGKWIYPLTKKLVIKKPDVEELLNKCGRYLTHLNISDYACKSSVIDSINQHCPNLTHLDFKLYMNNMQRLHCEKGLSNLNNLISIKIKTNDISSLSLEAVNNYNLILNTFPHNIKEIFLETSNHAIGLGKEFSLMLLNKYQRLVYLSLRSFTIRESTMRGISWLKCLVHLDLCGSVLRNESLIASLTKLEYLDLSWVHEINENLIIHIAENFKKLKHLNLNRCYSVSSFIFEKLTSIETLEYLNFSHALNIDGNLIETIGNECKNLKQLEIAGCPGISKYSLIYLTKLKNLEILNLEDTQDFDGEFIASLADKSINLKRLDLSQAQTVTSTDLLKLSKLNNLESLRLHRVRSIDENLISSFAINLKYLKHFDISFCSNLNLNDYYIISNIENLEKLVMINALNARHAIPIKMNKLKFFNCTSCGDVTDTAVRRFIKNCPHLEKLLVYNTAITYETFIAATQETNYRKNNVHLTLYANNYLVRSYRTLNDDKMNLLKISPQTAYINSLGYDDCYE